MNHALLLLLTAPFVLAPARAQVERERTVAEFKTYVSGKLTNMTDEQLTALATLVDKNSDGVIDLQEFADRMTAVRQVLSQSAPPVPSPRQPAGATPAGSPATDAPATEASAADAGLPPGTNATVLLITSDELAAAWAPFARWKTRQGRATRILTVHTIAQTYSAATIQEQIRLCVRDHIETQGTRWVILGGDSQPDGGPVPGGHRTYHRLEPNGIPTDIVYLSPTDWDADGDGRCGEWEDDRAAITYPDGSVGLGRIPVRTSADVAAFTDKVIAYESKYPETEFASRMLFTCTEPMATAKVAASWDDHIDAQWHGTAERYFPDGTKPSVSHVRDALSNGLASKMHIHGHGKLDAWLLSDARFTAANVAELENQGTYPLITTVSCNTGEYDSARDPSIVESMLRAPNAGSVAIVAPIRTGKMHLHDMRRDFQRMIREGKLDGTTATMTGYWTHGLGEQCSTGEALMRAKADLAKDAEKSARYHLCICELNLLGDPTLDFRAQTPRTPKLDAPAALTTGKCELTIQTDAANATVCVHQAGELLLTETADASGSATFSIELASTEAVDITVSGPSLNSRSIRVPVRG